MYYLPQKRSLFSLFKTSTLSQVLSLEISDIGIRFVVMECPRGNIQKTTVKVFGTKAVPAGAIISGVIRQEETVRTILTALIKEVRVKDVILTIPDSYTYTLPFVLSAKKPREQKQVIQHFVEEQIPQTITKTVFYHTEVYTATKHSMVLVRAIPVEFMRVYRALIRKAGGQLRSVGTVSDTLAPLLTATPDAEAVLAIHIGERETSIAILGKARVYEVSVVPVGAVALTRTLQQAHGHTVSKIQTHKRQQGYTRAQGSPEMLYSVAQLLERIAQEANSALGRYAKTVVAATVPVQQVVLSGLETVYPGIIGYFAQQFTQPVHHASIWKNLYNFDEKIPPIIFEESVLYAPVIGASVAVFTEKK